VLAALLSAAALAFDAPSTGAAAQAARKKQETKESALRKEIIPSPPFTEAYLLGAVGGAAFGCGLGFTARGT
jgi:hypothetical protein